MPDSDAWLLSISVRRHLEAGKKNGFDESDCTMRDGRASAGRFWIYLVFGGLISVAIVLGAALFVVRNQEPRLAVADDAAEPVQILPRQPDGVTIIIKQPSDDEETSNTPGPLVEPVRKLDGFGIHLGTAQSFSQLSARFVEIGQINQELLLDQLEPRATLEETENGLKARLMVGPFGSMEEARTICANIALPSGIECEAGPFRGEVIARE